MAGGKQALAALLAARHGEFLQNAFAITWRRPVSHGWLAPFPILTWRNPMAQKDLASRVALAQAIGPATIDADTTPAAIDLAGFQSAAIAIAVGVGGITFTTSNKIEFTLQHSDDNSSYADVTVDDINGKDAPATVTSGIVKALTAEHASADVSEIGYIGGKRYLKLKADFSGTHGTGTPISATVIKGNPTYIPAA
jgi:hypothetical protein